MTNSEDRRRRACDHERVLVATAELARFSVASLDDAADPPTPSERLTECVNRLAAKYLPRDDRPALTLVRGGLDEEVLR